MTPCTELRVLGKIYLDSELWDYRKKEIDSFCSGHEIFSKNVQFGRNTAPDRIGYLKGGKGYCRQKEYINRTTKPGRWLGHVGWGV